MRILTSVCFATALLPISGLSALANPIDESGSSTFGESQITEANGAYIRANDYSFSVQNSLTNNSFAVSPWIAQIDQVTADNSWNSSDPNSEEVQDVKLQLQDIQQRNFLPSRGVPAITVANPLGVGADRGFFSGFSYQESVRFSPGEDDATMAFGAGFGDAQKTVGVEVSYVLASFGGSRDFGSGGFNLKLHRQIGDDLALAAGWNSFLSIGDDNDLEDSVFFAATKIFKTRKDLDSAFSRIALTVGTGNGQFRSLDAIENDDGEFNVFGSLAFRVARPLSFVTEWTGQDLAMGLSVSPFRNIPVTVNLGLRDIAGEGDGARFVAGIGTGF